MATPSVKFNFAGKRALVTGASRGIGEAIAIALDAYGAETFALSKTQAHLDKLVAAHPSIKPVCVDLADSDATRKAVESLGQIDLLVNNAGISGLNTFLEVPLDEFERIFQINVKSVLNVSQVVAKRMIASGKPGSIVNISSQASMRAMPLHTSYCTSKAALDMMTKMMALELGSHQIRVNSVNPTVTLTDMGREFWGEGERTDKMKSRIPLNKFAEVENVVEPVLYLLSESSAMIHGTHVMIDGGFSAA